MPQRNAHLSMSKHEPIIRRALPVDAEGIALLYAELVGNSAIVVLPERIAEVSQDSNTALFVCEGENGLCGTALASLCADVMFKSQPFAVVENVIVSSAARSQGIGTMMLRHIEAFCLANNCSKIMLLSSVNRVQAHRFFERAGFGGSEKRGFIKYRRNFKEMV